MVIVAQVLAESFTTETSLREYLLKDYDRAVPPGLKVAPTTVGISFVVEKLYDISEAKNQFSVIMFLRLEWKDPRLAFGSLNVSVGYELASMDFGIVKDRIWLPDVFVVNSLSIGTSVTPDSDWYLEVYPSGYTRWSRRLVMDLHCVMDYRRFPFDHQRCGIDFELYKSRVSDVALEVQAKEVDSGFSSIETAQWNNFTEYYDEGYREYATGQFSYANIKFEMARIQTYWIWNAILPAMLFVCTSYSGFWIDPAAVPGRITLSVICVLISLTNKVRVASSMPGVGYNVWMVAYLFGCTIFNFAAVITYSIVNYVNTEKLKLAFELEASQRVEMGEAVAGDSKAALRVRFFSWFIRFLKIDWHMRWFFPLAFIVYNLIMFSIVDSFARE